MKQLCEVPMISAFEAVSSFALTSWTLSPLALWVRYFAEEGVDLTIKQDKLPFNKMQSQ